jgi:hypothetical protein
MTTTVILTDEQMAMVRSAAATLRWAERDKFTFANCSASCGSTWSADMLALTDAPTPRKPI